MFYLGEYWDKTHLVRYMKENDCVINGKKRNMKEVMNLIIDDYVMKKCLK